MSIKYILLLSRQGKLRLAKWFNTMNRDVKARTVRDLTQLVLARRPRMCNIIEYKETRVIYRRYASLFFVFGIEGENELMVLEIIHHYVQMLDRSFGNVTELDLIFNFQKAYAVLDEVVLAGEMQESSKSTTLRVLTETDAWEEHDNMSSELHKAFF